MESKKGLKRPLEKLTIKQLNEEAKKQKIQLPPNSLKREIINILDKQRLLELENVAAKELPPNTLWNEEQAREILGPLFHQPVEQWNNNISLLTGQRISLLCKLGVDLQSCSSGMKEFMMNTFPKYICPQIQAKPYPQGEVMASALKPFLLPLAKKEYESWTPEEVDPIVNLLQGKASVIADDFQAATLYQNFCQYCAMYPEISKRIDPFVLIAAVGGAALPGPWAAALVAYPNAAVLVAPPLPPTMNGHAYAWNFGAAGLDVVTHFIGFMQGAVPGLHFWLINAAAPPIYY